jgi:hypothetical protein
MPILNLMINIPGDRTAVLARRDSILDNLTQELGIRVSMYQDGLDVYLVDEGIPTLGDLFTGNVTPTEYQASVISRLIDDKGDHIPAGDPNEPWRGDVHP